MVKNEYHVTYDRNRRMWKIKNTENAKVSRYSDTKKEAVDIATKFSKNNNSELFIHKKDGSFENRNSFGNDPHPPRG